MNHSSYMSNESLSKSPNYKLACELGYELSKNEYSEMIKYAKLVRNEHNSSSGTSLTDKHPKFQRCLSPLTRPSELIFHNTSNGYSEDLWIKYLREYLDSEDNGFETPAYDTIKARELQVQNEIRKRRLDSLAKLPDIPSEFRAVLSKYLSSSNSTQIIQKFCIPITTSDLRTLRPPNWLNDEIINFYFELIRERSKFNPKLPKIHIFNTFFYPKLKSNGYSSIRRWTTKVDIFAYDMILIPIHLGIHWCFAEINFKQKAIYYYDSLHNSNNSCLTTLQEYLVSEHVDKKGSDGKNEFDFEKWSLSSPKNIPCQQNGYDCGVFACVYAEFRSRNAEFTFSQKNMNYFRDKLSYEIINGILI